MYTAGAVAVYPGAAAAAPPPSSASSTPASARHGGSGAAAARSPSPPRKDVAINSTVAVAAVPVPPMAMRRPLPSSAPRRTRRMYLVKWQGLPYSAATWEWEHDVADDRTIGRFQRFQHPPSLVNPHPAMLQDVRPPADSWKRYAESPKYLGGRELRPYQLEGLNWLVFSWYQVRCVRRCEWRADNCLLCRRRVWWGEGERQLSSA